MAPKSLQCSVLLWLVVAPAAETGDTMDAYNQVKRERAQFEYEQELRKIQLERLRNRQGEDPRIAAELRDADARRAATPIKTEIYALNSERMTCRACPGQAAATHCGHRS